MKGLDFVVLFSYFTTMIVIGSLFSRRMRSADQYFAGGKQIPWWLGGISFLMSYVSALSIVVYSGMGYQFGLVALTLYWASVPAVLIGVWLFARKWRRAGVLTPTQFLEQRFSPVVRQLFVWSGILLKLADEALKIVAIGAFVSAGLGMPAIPTMTVLGVTILVYAVMGGLWAVVVTDLVQFILVTCTVILLVPLAWHASGGWSHVAHVTSPEFFHFVRAPYGWRYIASFFLLDIVSYAGNWSLIQKFYSARSDDEAARIGWLAAALFFLLPPTWIVTGMLARGIFPAAGIDPQTLYAHVGIALLPPGMLGLIVAALFAATMSVLASGYNVIAAVLTLDVFHRFVHRNASERELVLAGRIFTAVVATAVLAIAIGITRLHWTIFDTMIAVFSFLLPPTVLPMLAGLLSPRLSTAGALASSFAGAATGLAFFLYGALSGRASVSSFQFYSIVVPIVVTVSVIVLCALLFSGKGEERERADAFVRGLAKRSVDGEASLESPVPLAGAVVAVMGGVLLVISLEPMLAHQAVQSVTASVGGTLLGLGLVMLVGARSLDKGT